MGHAFTRLNRFLLSGLLAAGFISTLSRFAAAQLPSAYLPIHLVSDFKGQRAFHRDQTLVNPWGIAFSPRGPFWIADNGAGVSTLYNSVGTKFPGPLSPLVVTIPPPTGSTATAAPTGIVFNGTSDFLISLGGSGPSAPSLFIFDTADGTISGWSFNVDFTHAILVVDNSVPPGIDGTVLGAVYKGLAIGNNGSSNLIYATNFRDGVIEMYDASFRFVKSFTDPRIVPDAPNPGFAPFGIRNINGNLYVAFAVQNSERHDDVAGPGNGFVDVFDLNGNFISTLASGGPLNSPWGLALAPANFGQFSNTLLVGNFGDGHISAFDPITGAFLGQLLGPKGNPIAIDGLWGLAFGNGGLAGSTNTLFFTAGIVDKTHGLFGKISVLPQGL